MPGHAGAHGVELNVATTREAIGLAVDRRGAVTPLPYRPGPAALDDVKRLIGQEITTESGHGASLSETARAAHRTSQRGARNLTLTPILSSCDSFLLL